MDKTAQVLSMESQQGSLQTTVRLKAGAKALSNSLTTPSQCKARGRIYLGNTPGLKNIYSIFMYRKAVVFTGKKKKKKRTSLDCPAELISVSKIPCESSHVLL